MKVNDSVLIVDENCFNAGETGIIVSIVPGGAYIRLEDNKGIIFLLSRMFEVWDYDPNIPHHPARQIEA